MTPREMAWRLTGAQRRTLKAMRSGEWAYWSDVPSPNVGFSTFGILLRAGLIEQCSDSRVFRITPNGRAALRALQAAAPDGGA